jgi:hypothetical protein
MKNRLLDGSEPQQAMTIALICGLESLHEKGWEVVVGQQNWCILDGSHEVDIPVIAIKNKRIVKVAVEVDGIYWHTEDDHLVKDYRLRDKGWTPFHYTASGANAEKQFPAMEFFVSHIHDHILRP